jgi:hypothetical protein
MYVFLTKLIIFYATKLCCSFVTMSGSLKRTYDGESEDSSDGCIGPMPSEAAKPKKCKCK